MPSASDWLLAARPRTLPLALAVTGMGNLLVFRTESFQISVCLLSILTTVFLQILSNFANDYGDSRHGADSEHRKGPLRAVQTGKITPRAMITAIGLFAGFSLMAGLLLLWTAFQTDWGAFLPVFAIGLAAIAAAYFYTNGTRPYGYRALGDVSVFLFFGWVAVLATAYLHTRDFRWLHILPATAMGFWSTAVLNINNLRDMDSDQKAGKQTIPLFLGLEGGKRYQAILVLGGAAALFLYGWLDGARYVPGCVPGLLLMKKALDGVNKGDTPSQLDACLKPQALGTFLAVAGMALVRFFLP